MQVFEELEKSAGGRCRSNGVILLLVRINCWRMKDLKAIGMVMNKIEKKRELVGSSYRTHATAQRVILVLIYRPHGAICCLQSLDGRVDTF